jgi:hypothetical protein
MSLNINIQLFSLLYRYSYMSRQSEHVLLPNCTIPDYEFDRLQSGHDENEATQSVTSLFIQFSDDLPDSGDLGLESESDSVLA